MANGGFSLLACFNTRRWTANRPYNNSRNVTSFWFNWIYINIGFHSAHHLRPGVHWSLLPDLHNREEIAPHLDPRLDEKSMFSFYWNWFAGKHRFRRSFA